MSIRTNPMKAVPTLLKRLVTVEKHVNLNDLKSELTKIKDLFSKVKKNEEELLDTLADVKRAVAHPSIPEPEDLEMIKVNCNNLEPVLKQYLLSLTFP
ncbi:hypothetical protein GYH30_049601 [Glycine max]|nr:hypothetical protein GYH30_049601 [Glycine max]